MKIYTRTGDDGSTGLLGPGRVSKSAPRVEAYGSVDETNAAIGAARTADSAGWVRDDLERIQSQLFDIGAELATTTPQPPASHPRIADSDVEALEASIDRLERDLPPLANFLLPGGTALAAQLHVARTVCRRAERRLVSLAETEAVEARLIRYLNRLGDLLFVMARWCNHRAGAGEIIWRSQRREVS